MTDPFQIDPRIERARTLPSRAYHDASTYERIRDRVLTRSWQPAGDATRLKAPGHVVPLTLLEGSLDEPLVLTRADDGEARCLSNVCTHRGMLVVEGEGHMQSLRCRYHGRRFELDGRFRSMPEFDDVEVFPGPEDDLPRLPLREWGPLLFTSLDPMCDFEDWIRPVTQRVDWLHPERFIPDERQSQDYLISANWALYCDNYLEGFHIPYVHAASLGGKLDYDQYRTEVFEWSNLQIGVAAEGQRAFAVPDDHPDAGKRIAAWYFWLFPNVMMNFYPWGLSLNVVQPLGPTRTRVLFRTYLSDASVVESSVERDLHRVEMEDEEIVEATQKGVRSRLYDRGRYSPGREQGPHHFHTLLASALAE
jgi:phenylpropionate dioxygenase-like ring-hydroxylating dioxygenase large terminal subunit